jgi:metal-responsive CopG/Arc/MetJ family transcriptional regulator
MAAKKVGRPPRPPGTPEPVRIELLLDQEMVEQIDRLREEMGGVPRATYIRIVLKAKLSAEKREVEARDGGGD